MNNLTRALKRWIDSTNYKKPIIHQQISTLSRNDSDTKAFEYSNKQGKHAFRARDQICIVDSPTIEIHVAASSIIKIDGTTVLIERKPPPKLFSGLKTTTFPKNSI